MQQYSSLSEQNSQIDANSTDLTTILQIRAELWLERSLNNLQNRLNECLVSAFTTNQQVVVPEAEIFQTVVNELHSALKTAKVAVALIQPEQTSCKVCYVSPSPTPHSQPPVVEIVGNKRKKLHLKLKKVIDIQYLQTLENQQPPLAWQLRDNTGVVIGWLMIATLPLSSGDETLEGACAKLTSQLMSRAAQCCNTTISQTRNIVSLQQQCHSLKRFNQDLTRINHLKNQFLANTSHEIRTPLSSIIGFTQLLLAKGYDPTQERHQEYLNIIQSSGKHLLALINDILDLSKIEANQLEVQYETVNVPSLCQNVFALLKEKAASKSLKLHLDLDPNVTTLVADPLRLKQMLLNLLFNAMKFTSTGTIGLQVKTDGLFVYFTVWDTGRGISTEHQANLFRPYFQITSTTSRDEGTGLGLTVTQKLAELHGGRVEVESEVDRGSRFTIILPQKQVEGDKKIEKDEELQEDNLTPQYANCTPVATPRASTTRESRPTHWLLTSNPPTDLTPRFPTSNPNILLVEDNLPNGQMMQTYLERLAYQVTWVKNATELWEALEHPLPAVILMDIDLPDGNSLELVHLLRENQQYQDIPIVAQTAMAMKGDRETCIASGFNDYISKPIDLELLATIVSKYSIPPNSHGSSHKL
jgi:signal transduction histidine kinase/CheY-like chemotaxis protein